MKSLFQIFPKTAISHRAIYFAAFIVLVLASNAAAQGLPPDISTRTNPDSAPMRAPDERGMSPSAASPAAASTDASTATSPAQTRRRASPLKICGNPQVACKTDIRFQPYDLPFQMRAPSVIYETELFYAIVLQSVKAPADECEIFVPERDRLAAQALFPDRKVFSSRCYEPGEIGYTNTSAKAHFMAVYGGLTLAEANRMLARVRATGKFPGANIRRMRAMINGT